MGIQVDGDVKIGMGIFRSLNLAKKLKKKDIKLLSFQIP